MSKIETRVLLSRNFVDQAMARQHLFSDEYFKELLDAGASVVGCNENNNLSRHGYNPSVLFGLVHSYLLNGNERIFLALDKMDSIPRYVNFQNYQDWHHPMGALFCQSYCPDGEDARMDKLFSALVDKGSTPHDVCLKADGNIFVEMLGHEYSMSDYGQSKPALTDFGRHFKLLKSYYTNEQLYLMANELVKVEMGKDTVASTPLAYLFEFTKGFNARPTHATSSFARELIALGADINTPTSDGSPLLKVIQRPETLEVLTRAKNSYTSSLASKQIGETLTKTIPRMRL